ncbi:uncharacterized protein LOC124930758 [Impatiens glandulifera]|uniref:uncharacterized protein LOC124930758 n=1 Tax=Impatiens glandulifera TaxID=253017 RepID=UPI001FB09F46|nr:uncharacterized protein LOC124930758 [Impatiens glandulifera]
MVGNGIRMRDSFTLNNTNVFAALTTLRKKKKNKPIKLIKDQGSLKKQQEEEKNNPEPQVLWTLTPLIAESWADVEDDDDFDYFASTAPPQVVWGTAPDLQSDEKEIPGLLEESESGEEEEKDVVDENEEHKPTKVVSSEKEPTITAVLLPTKDPNRQLSKKELKKKGLAELDAVLAELGYYSKSEASCQDDPNDKKIDKTSKQHKKKDKAMKEAKGTSSMKKVASMKKKKKSSKEMDVAAKAAANEVAVRNAKLAAAKKKKKIHYNQQPLR